MDNLIILCCSDPVKEQPMCWWVLFFLATVTVTVVVINECSKPTIPIKSKATNYNTTLGTTYRGK